MLKVAFGFDSHRVTYDRPLILGGVWFEGEPGLCGHSDADVIAHAITDALASAAGLGDIGRLFPDDNPAYEGADSVMLLGKVARLAADKGFIVVNCDCVLVAEKPKISARSSDMNAILAKALGVSEAAVSVRGKTNEGMDSIGRGEGMAAYAVILIEY